MPSLQLEDFVFQKTENSFRLGEILPDDFAWQIDMKREKLSFYSQASGQVAFECPVQLVGSGETAGQTWLWAWANYESQLPDTILESVRKMKALAEESSVGQIYLNDTAFSIPSKSFGTEAAILCAGVSGGFCPYSCPYDGGILYTVIETAPQARDLPADPMRTIRAITAAISTFSFDHKQAIRAYLGEPDADGVYAKSGVRITFDAQGRIGEIGFVLQPPKKPASPLDSIKRLFGR